MNKTEQQEFDRIKSALERSERCLATARHRIVWQSRYIEILEDALRSGRPVRYTDEDFDQLRAQAKNG